MNELNFMRINTILRSVVVLFCFLISFTLSAQTEDELKSKAEKAFRDDNYVEASKLYSQLLSFNRSDVFYNYRYGICLLYNSRVKQEAIKHLTYVSKQENPNPEVYFYLGKAYHLNYEFGDAIKLYNTYKQKAGSKINVTLEVDRHIQMSENGKRLLSSTTEMVVLDKKEIENATFFRVYDLKDIGGDILVNAQFQSKVDKKNKHVPIIHFPAKPNMIYYSSYGEDEKNGKDIYIRRRLPDGSWSLPQTINGGVNTQFDEDFPYMHPNGQYLYFCSKGHNSMGGFDIFRSKFDKETNTFGPAENLDFPISSPDNDLFYVVDSLDKNAYFASSRQSLDGKIHVYKVRVDRVPIQIAVIKANFNSTLKPDNKKISVDVFDYANGSKVGTFNSNDKGSVLMTFPKGGKYEYQMRVDGVTQTFKSVVSVPFLTELKPLKQKLVHEKVEQGETVTIVNLFDEAVEDPVATFAEIARLRAELNPNSDQFDLKKLDNASQNKEIYNEIGYGKLSDREVQENLEKLAANQESQTQDLKDLQQKAIDKVVQNAKDIEKLQADLKSTVAKAETKTGGEKRDLIEEAGAIVNELNRLENESKALLPYADSLNGPIAKSAAEDQKARKVVDDINKAFKDNNPSLAAQKISENKDQIKDLQKDNKDLSTEGLTKEVVAKREEIKKLTAKQKEYLDMKVKAKEELLDLDIQLDAAKAKDKPAIQKKIDDKQEEIKMIEEELKTFDPKITKKKEELSVLEKKLSFIQEIANSKAPSSKSTKDEAAKKLAATDNANTRTLKAYVAEQSKQMGVDMTAQKMSSSSNGGAPSKAKETLTPKENEVIADLAPDYNKNIEAIKNDAALSEEQKIKETQKQNKNVKFQVSKELASVNEQVKQNPGDAALKKKQNELETLNEKLNTNIAADQATLEEKYPESNPPKKLTDMQLANRVKPNHFAVLQTLDDTDGPKSNKTTEKAQSEDQEFIRLLGLEKNKLEARLKEKPNDEGAKHELSLIKSLLTETDKRIERRTMGMAAFQIPEVKTDDAYVPKDSTNLAENKTENKTENKSENKANPENKGSQVNVTENKTENKTNPESNGNQNNLTENKSNPENNGSQVNVTENKTENKANPENNGSQGNVTENKTENKTNSENNTEKASTAIDYPSIKEVAPMYEKNTNAIKENKSYTTEQKQEKLIMEENKLQTSVNNQLKTVETQLTKNPADTALQHKKERLEVVKTESENRENESKQVLVNDLKAKIDKDKLQASADKTYAQDIKAAPNDEEKIKREEKLQQQLQTKIAANEKRIKANENVALEAENKSLNELLDESKNRVETIRNPSTANKSGNQTQETASANSTQKEDKSAEELRKLDGEITDLKTKLTDPNLSKTEKAAVQKELNEKQTAQNVILDQKLATQAPFVAEKAKQASPAASSKSKQEKEIYAQDTLALANAKTLESELTDLKKDLAKTKKEAKRNELTQQINDKQNALNEIYESVAYSSQQLADVQELKKVDPKAEVYDLESKSSLEKRKTATNQEIADLNEQLEQDKLAIKEAKKDEKAVIAKRIVNNEKRADLLKSEIKGIDNVLKEKETESKAYQSKDPASVSYSDTEKQSLSTQPNYAEMKTAYEEKILAEKTKNDAYIALEEAKAKYADAVSKQAKNPSQENQQEVKAAFENVKKASANLEETKKTASEKDNAYKQLTASQTDLPKLEQLFRDGVAPGEALIAERIKENKQGFVPFEILNEPQVEEASERIHIGEEMPMGLLYRVQVGAFRKPLKSKMYAEFKPVTGEPIHDGITRYITGYFGSLGTASQAKKAIRKLGYRDAFIVAYCDGKRISISKAKKLQASGQCVPTIQDENSTIKTPESNKTNPVVVKTDDKTNPVVKTDTSDKSSTKGMDYNKAPGAVKATPVETKLGLFFTVQIGAYRKPATAKQLRWTENVVSKLLSDGMIRYSTGIFPSVEAAQGTKQAVIGAGVSDAFITAYYKGERITLAEANRLLKENGSGILEK